LKKYGVVRKLSEIQINVGENTHASLVLLACNIITDSRKRSRGEKLPVLFNNQVSKTDSITRSNLYHV